MMCRCLKNRVIHNIHFCSGLQSSRVLVKETDPTTKRSKGLTDSLSKAEHRSASSSLLIKHSEKTSEAVADQIANDTAVPVDTVSVAPNHEQSTGKIYKIANCYCIVSNIV